PGGGTDRRRGTRFGPHPDKASMGKIRRSFVLASVSALALSAPATAAARGALVPDRAARLPLLFTENARQWPAASPYQARGAGLVARVRVDGVSFELGQRVLALRFAGAAADARVEGREPQAARVHFLGAGRGACQAATCARVRVAGLYPGVD